MWLIVLAAAAGLVAVVAVVLIRRALHLRYEQLRRRYEGLLEDAPIAYHEIDCNGIVRWVNRAECRLLGLSAYEMLGRPVWEFVADEEREASRAAVYRKLHGQQQLAPFLRPYRCREGVKRVFEIHETLIRDAAGKVIGMRSAMIDVTEREAARKKLEEQARERERANRELAEALAAAKQATELKNRFLANVSHEIRTPLHAILGMTELLLKTPLNEQQRDYARTALEAGEALLELINDLLDISKIETGRLRLEPAPFNPAALANSVAALLAVRASAKGVQVSCEVDPATPSLVIGDAGRVRQVLLNLVANAVKFTEQGWVRVSLSVLGQGADRVRLRYAVADTGIGIEPACQPLIFERFVQGDGSSTRRYGGTGLGLAISKQLIELMGGQIDFESRPGHGSTFWFDLELEKACQPAASPQPSPEKRAAPARPCRILLAEDNPINQKIALRMLEQGGFEAEVVTNGEQAVEAISKRTYDLVLMDVQMPGMDGLEATMHIRRMESGRRHIPIVALTANAMAGDRERCLAAGMDDYLPKPVRREQLWETVRRWIAASEATVKLSWALNGSENRQWPGTARFE